MSAVLLLVVALVLTLGAGGALLWAWRVRNALGARLAVDYLASRHIPAVVKLTRLDSGGVAGALTLGPADHPTLVVPRFEAEFAPAPLFSTPALRHLTLDRPRLELSYDGHKLDFGALQPLVDATSRGPKAKGPSPDVVVSDGELGVRTPYGRVSAGIGAALAAGVLETADIQLRPAPLALPDGGMTTGLTGRVQIRRQGAGRYRLQGALTAATATLQRAALRGPRISVQAELPFRQGADEPLAGPIRVSLQGSSAAISGPGVGASRGAVEAVIAGALSGSTAAPVFHGDATAKAHVDDIEAGSSHVDGLTLYGRAARLDLGSDRRVGAQFSLHGDAHAGLAGLRPDAVTLSAMQVAAAGQVRSDPAGPVLTATAAFAATGGLDRARANALADRLAPGPYGAALRAALTQALVRTSVSAPSLGLTGARNVWALRLDQPVQARSDGGARLVLSGFGARWTRAGPSLTEGGALTLAGGGFPDARLAVAGRSLNPRRLDAQLGADVAGSAGPLQGARLGLAGRLASDDGVTRFTLARCATLAFETLQGPDARPVARAASVDLCPASGAATLVISRNAAWQAAARVEHLTAEAPGADIAIDGGDADLRFSGRGSAVAGQASITSARLRDTAKTVRFRPLQISGPIRLAAQRLTGALDIALSEPTRPLGTLRVADDLRSGAGSLALDTPRFAFAPDGLQPAAILPGLAGLGQDVTGPASATVRMSWKGPALTSRVLVHVDGLRLKTAAGLVSGVRTQLTLTGLDPLTSAPAQHLSADRIAAVVPLTDLSATYALGGDALQLAGAQASLAGGRISLDPTRLALTPGATVSGVVRADGVELGPLVDALNLSRALTIQAKVEGVLPFSFGPQGLRITDGRLAAMGPGRLTLRRQALTGVAAGGAGAPSTSTVQDFAYQALEDLAFTELDARVASRPQGRLGIVFHIRGRHDPAVAQEARVGLIDLLKGRAFNKPLPLPKGTQVNLTLDTSLNLDDLLSAYLGRSAPVQR